MSKLPYMQFYPSDWLNDPALRVVSHTAKGVWIDMLCLMWMSPERGALRFISGRNPEPNVIAKALGLRPNRYSKVFTELLASGVLSVNEEGAIVSRRMLRDEELRIKRTAAGQRGGNPILVKQKVNQTPNQIPEVFQSQIQSQIQRDMNSPPENSCSEPSPKASQPEPVEVAMEFPVVGGKVPTWPLPRSKLAEWSDTFPGVDVESECRKARQWCIDNPTKRKTAAGMTKFLNSWLSRVQNDGNRRGCGQPAGGLFAANGNGAGRNGSRNEQRIAGTLLAAAEFCADDENTIRTVDGHAHASQAHIRVHQARIGSVVRGAGELPLEGFEPGGGAGGAGG